MTEKEYLTSQQLADRWKIKPATLRSQRCRKRGPAYTKPFGPRGEVRYDLADVEEWERTHRVEVGTDDDN